MRPSGSGARPAHPAAVYATLAPRADLARLVACQECIHAVAREAQHDHTE